MKTTTSLAAALVALACGLGAGSASADTAEASCQVRKDGDTKQGASGPCTFSQRQGYIDIDLRNGKSYSLSPGKNPGHYRDQKGNKVIRTQSGSNTEDFKWEGGTRISVTLVSGHSGNQHGHSNYQAGRTVPDLADLVGAKAGQAEGELERRGYKYASGSTSGNAKYSSWYNRGSGRCAMIRTEDGRYQSIVEAPPADCGR
jgi:hypothetical protein